MEEMKPVVTEKHENENQDESILLAIFDYWKFESFDAGIDMIDL